MFEGLKTWEPAVPDDVLREERERRDAGEHVPLVGAPVVVERRTGNTEDERDAAAGQHRAGRPHEGPRSAERQRHLEDRARQDRRQDLRHADLEPQPDLPEDVDRDDDGSDVQPRIAGVRQDHGVRAPAERERPAGHILSPNGLVRRPHSTTVGIQCRFDPSVSDQQVPTAGEAARRPQAGARGRVGRASPRSGVAIVGRRGRARAAGVANSVDRRRAAGDGAAVRRRDDRGGHRPHATTASSSSSSAAAWRRSTATTTGAPSCSSPAAPSRPRCTATRARWAVRCASVRRRRSPI